jgi:hypothetical protein
VLKYPIQNLATLFLTVEQEGRLSPDVTDIPCEFFLTELPVGKKKFINARHSFAVKYPLFCAISIFDLQQTLNSQAAIMRFKSQIYFNVMKALVEQICINYI